MKSPNKPKAEYGWVMIPPETLADKDLSIGEKVVYGRIMGLSPRGGYCFASNDWLGEQLGYTPRTTETYIARLVSKGYLRRGYGKNGKRERRLYLTEKGGSGKKPSR